MRAVAVLGTPDLVKRATPTASSLAAYETTKRSEPRAPPLGLDVGSVWLSTRPRVAR